MPGTVVRRLAAAGLGVLLSCTGAEQPAPTPGAAPSPRPRPGGRIVFGVVGAPATLDPYSPLASDLTRFLARPVYPSLYRFLPDGRTRPSLASSLRRTGRRSVVTLRPARWSSGRPISARDVVASALRARWPSGFSAFETVRALGPRRVVFVGSARVVPRALATAAYVLPGGRAGGVSGGPYLVESFRPGLEVVYVANPRWGGGRRYLRRVTVRFAAAQAQLLGLLERGDLDAGAPLSAVNLTETLPAAINSTGVLGWERVLLDFGGSSLARGQRASLAGALDRSEIESVFVRADGRVSNSVTPGPGEAGARGPWPGALGRRQSPAGPVELSAPGGDELLELVRRAAYTQLSASGWRVDAVAIEQQTFYTDWRVGLDTDVAVRRLAGAPSWGRGQERIEALDAYPLLHVKTYVAHRRGVEGIAPNPTLEGPLWNMEDWFLSRSN